MLRENYVPAFRAIDLTMLRISNNLLKRFLTLGFILNLKNNALSKRLGKSKGWVQK